MKLKLFSDMSFRDEQFHLGYDFIKYLPPKWEGYSRICYSVDRDKGSVSVFNTSCFDYIRLLHRSRILLAIDDGLYGKKE